MDDVYRRLDEQVDALRAELEREREARKDQADRLKKIEGLTNPRRGSMFRWMVIGGGAYLLGAKAGRTRYEQIMAKGRQARDGARAALNGAGEAETPIPTRELRTSER
jgi:hypothetical protein